MLTKLLSTAVVALGVAGFTAAPASARPMGFGGHGYHGGGGHGFHGGGWGRGGYGYGRGWRGGGGYGWGLGALGLGLGLAAASPYYYGGYPYGGYPYGGYYGGNCGSQLRPVWNGYRYVRQWVQVCY